MKLLFILAFLAAAKLRAEGFVCINKEFALKILIYNHVHPQLGTRRGAYMVLVDTRYRKPHRTIGVFSDRLGTLHTQNGTYAGGVDWRMTNSFKLNSAVGRLSKGESVYGFPVPLRIKDLDFLIVKPEFKHSQPVAHGTPLPAKLMFRGRHDGLIELEIECTRYLKMPNSKCEEEL